MQTMHDYKQHAILYVDDEEMALKYFERSFGQEFRILTANSAAEGLKLIEAHGEDIGVLLTDQRMPGEKGVQLLERARQLRPRMVRMMVTAYADFGVTVDAVNLGNIFRYVSKPIQVEDMRNTLRRASEFYMLQRERDDLLHEKLSVLQSLVIADRIVSLGVLGTGIHQNLRNSLNAVRAFLEQAPSKKQFDHVDMGRLRDPAFWRDFHAQVLAQTQRSGEMIGLIDGSSSPSADTAIDPVTVLADVIRSKGAAFAAKGIVVSQHVPASLPALQTTANRLSRLFGLLLDNQLATLPEGALVSLTATVGTVDGQPMNIRFTLSDNGPGVPAGAVRAVFDPFSLGRVGDDQFGLNLLGIFFLVHHHGGSIEVVPQKEGGVSYCIEVPVGRAAVDAIQVSTRDFITNVMMNDSLWERLLSSN